MLSKSKSDSTLRGLYDIKSDRVRGSTIDPRVVGEVLPVDLEHEIYQAMLFISTQRISLGSFTSRQEAVLAILDVIMPEALRNA